MTAKIDYEDLLPHEFEERLARCPVAYLPLGTLEWHGPQNALGADFIQAREVFRRAARRFGGIVLPPVWVAPDRITGRETGVPLVGMDTARRTSPHQQLPGSLYWVPRGLFLALVEAILEQVRRAGFKCVMADGHGPSRRHWGEMAESWEQQFGLKLISADRDFSGRWRTQLDHAGRNETSIMMAAAPGLVDLSRLPSDRNEWPQGVAGEDPRDSTREYGEELIEGSVALIGEKLAELGFAAAGR